MESIDDILRSSKDEKAFRSLADTVRGGDAIAFVGAGIAARVGYGDWQKLIDALAESTTTRSAERQRVPTREIGSDLAWLADSCRLKLTPNVYFGNLKTCFKPRHSASRRTDQAVRILGRLPFHYVVTANYDETLARLAEGDTRAEAAGRHVERRRCRS